MGLKLYPVFVEAGLPVPSMLAEAVIGGGVDSPVPSILAELIRSLLPAMERYGIASRAEVAVETLADRLRAEVVSGGGCMATPFLIGAWTRTP